MRYALLLGTALAALAGAPASAAPVPIPSYEAGCASDAHDREVCLHTFSGREVQVPLPTGMEAGCVPGNTYRLWQVGDRLMAPLGDTLPLTAEQCRNGVSAMLPKVTQKTLFAVRFEGNDTPPRMVYLMAYPGDLWERLRAWSERNQLVVIDSAGTLARILEGQDIRYLAQVAALPAGGSARRVCLWVPARNDEDPPRECENLVTFHESFETLPMITTREVSNTMKTDVRMPVIASIESYPPALEAFVAMIHSNLK